MRFYAGIFSVLVVLALIPCQVGAQPAETGTIEGHVLDASTQEPLPGVNLVLIGTNRGTTTNNEGYFRLTGVTAGTYQLQASFIGYVPLRQAVRVEAGQTVTLQLTLQPDVLNLQAAVVTATRTERTQREVPVSMQVMNARELERAAPTYSIADQLRTVPGLYGENGGGEVAANVFVRGIPAPGQFRYMTIQGRWHAAPDSDQSFGTGCTLSL
ncbi:carboxypeptidase-like regulatory domain-containing protein [Rhodothermus marinus]|uniref:carboxypeptidase-like regulatory domain-containing protein n=1 Tax=Rhodothermus marinus TaxID=29549 RepID=UPI0026EDB34F|nr:TonB-dependent receptor [Rhodothermus marinus]